MTTDRTANAWDWNGTDMTPLPPGHTRRNRPPAPKPTAEEQAMIDWFEQGEPAPESFDALAALRRIKALALTWEGYQEPKLTAHLYRHCGVEVLAALRGPT